MKGFLQPQYGVDLDRVTWVCTDDPHLAEYHDPAIVERAPSGYNFGAPLLNGRIDAAVLGKDLPKSPDIRSLIPDRAAAARAWHAENQAIPINPVFVVDADLSRQRPDIVRELYRLLAESKARDATGANGIDVNPFGVDALRRSLAIAIDYALEQHIIPRRFQVEELFDDTTRTLGN